MSLLGVRRPDMDLSRIPPSTHGHDFHCGLSRVVMVRKTEQRTFVQAKAGAAPQLETVTRETVETFSGGRRVTTSEKRDVQPAPPDALLLPRSNGPSKSISPRSSVSPQEPRSPGNTLERTPTIPRAKSDYRIKSRKDSMNDGLDEDFALECLRAHNEYRAKHAAPPLRLNKKLCKHSADWARRLASRGHLEHRQNSDYGENIFCSWSSSPNHTVTGREPVDNWYMEIKEHPFGKEPKNLKSGHFSQVVWRDSRELGVAVAHSRNGQIFVVCNYLPPGNFIGSFTENVPPLGGFPKDRLISPGSESDASSIDLEEFVKEGLKVHNDYRKKHGVPELGISDDLCAYATEWAKTLAKEDRFVHRPDAKYGENIFSVWSSDSTASAKEACDYWYKEIRNHTFGMEPKILMTGHFSQMIWKASRELGLGLARGKNGRIFIVANYHPRGNVMGQFVANVPRPV
ncbi:uncharacterized protein LOC135935478 isoform X1 [Cloeon dipterum]|uniref:SCP domain-containing protein n=2 Tax=Cloeon dipterum TaxID=197152 RepID=A0A8S1CGE6_9INSE|nr:Hypothetical predicted protein [Cloeon dipterum]